MNGGDQSITEYKLCTLYPQQTTIYSFHALTTPKNNINRLCTCPLPPLLKEKNNKNRNINLKRKKVRYA